MGALSERYTGKGPDGEDCDEGKGGDDMGFALTILWHPRGPGDTGIGGGGFTDAILSKTDGANVEGAVKSVNLRDVFAPEGNSSCIFESG